MYRRDETDIPGIDLIQMMLGSKGHKSGASLLAGGFVTLGPAKNMSKKPFLLKNERITNVF